jgi:DNA-binding CsgD family transcriptional regulator
MGLVGRRGTVNYDTLLSELIGMVYEAVDDTDGWFEFLRALADITDGTASAIFVHDAKTSDGNAVWAVQVAPEYLRLYDEYYHTKNIWVLKSGQLLTPGRVVMSHEVCPDSEVLRSEYYADFLKPQDIFHNIGATILCDGSMAALMTVLRPYSGGHFDEEQVRLVQVLMPHLQRALQIHQRLRLAEFRCDAAGEALNRMPVGIFVINSSWLSQPLNTAAERIAAEGDGIRIEHGRLAASRASEQLALRSLIADAMSLDNNTTHVKGGMLLVSRHPFRCPLEVLVTPLCSGYGIFGKRRRAVLIVVVDPEREPNISEEVLRRTWHLSHAEAAVAKLLSSGKDIKEIADELHISLNTARTHLKRVLSKTGSRRQAEAVLRCLQSCPTLNSEKQA